MAAPPPLPHPKDDPAVRGARLVRDALGDALALLRADPNVTPINRARAVNKAWQRAAADQAAHWQDLADRRAARLAWVEQNLPIRPDLPASASAADRQVLLAAWKTALDTARAATVEQRAAMLGDAEKYGDDTTRRAVLAAAVDDSQWPVVEQWAATHNAPAAEVFAEWRELREAAAGHGFDNLWITQAFRPLDQPAESKALPGLVEQHNADARQYNGTKHYAAPARPLIELEPDEIPQDPRMPRGTPVDTIGPGQAQPPAPDPQWQEARTAAAQGYATAAATTTPVHHTHPGGSTAA